MPKKYYDKMRPKKTKHDVHASIYWSNNVKSKKKQNHKCAAKTALTRSYKTKI